MAWLKIETPKVIDTQKVSTIGSLESFPSGVWDRSPSGN